MARRHGTTGAHSRGNTRGTHGAHSGHRQLLTIPILIAICSVLAVGIAFGAVMLHRSISSKSDPGATHDGTTIEATDMTADAQADESTQTEPVVLLPTPLIAEYGDVLIHCPVTTADLTELVFHQSDLEWALPVTTQLPEADPEQASNHRGTNRPAEQPTGDVYLNGSALHLWRSKAYTEMDTAIDCGARPGCPVYAPCDGTVVNVRQYLLENEIEDYEVHIQPYGHPELDMVVIHITDVCVEKGDQVVGGQTQIASVRNLQEYLAGIQLEDYAPVDAGGNHTHIQLNDTTFEGYQEKRLEGAYVPDY